MLADLPGPPLHETIPHFTDTRRRFRTLLDALETDRLDRASGARPEIEFALERKSLAGTFEDLLASGDVPERIVHHDTKINNVLIDDLTGEGICVIDLDTVMPGTVLYDFGHIVRTSAASGAEDERDLSKVGLDLGHFEAIAAGYLSISRQFLTSTELEHLSGAARIATFMVGVRFLADHLAGDTYFRIHREGHNLDRCRTQFRVVAEMEERAERMRAIVERYR
jgi:Ser/Thr protein kinase RdoA (MazF antagonist)